jgi:hypothetical protein
MCGNSALSHVYGPVYFETNLILSWDYQLTMKIGFA